MGVSSVGHAAEDTESEAASAFSRILKNGSDKFRFFKIDLCTSQGKYVFIHSLFAFCLELFAKHTILS